LCFASFATVPLDFDLDPAAMLSLNDPVRSFLNALIPLAIAGTFWGISVDSLLEGAIQDFVYIFGSSINNPAAHIAN
jgi:hypothetical protein